MMEAVTGPAVESATPVLLQSVTEPTERPITVCLVISSLEYGGAERQVVEMFRTFDRSRVRPIICSLSNNIPLADGLREHQEDLHIVPRRWRFDFTTVFRLARLLRQQRVDVTHAFLFDAEIIGRLAATLAGVPVVIASERNADYTRRRLHAFALWLTQPLVNAVVANSVAGKKFTLRTTRFSDAQVEVIHNGVDAVRFCPDREAGTTFRRRHGIPADALVVGMAGSYKRQKGHDVFLRMSAKIASRFDNAVFLIAGSPTGPLGASRAYQKEIETLAAQLDVRHRCHFIEYEKDMPAFYNACDVTVLLSRREGTPNVLLESMACGVPVVATAIADNSFVLGGTDSAGAIVSVDDFSEAAEEVNTLLCSSELRQATGMIARGRAREFSLDRAGRQLEQLYRRGLRKIRRS